MGGDKKIKIGNGSGRKINVAYSCLPLTILSLESRTGGLGLYLITLLNFFFIDHP